MFILLRPAHWFTTKQELHTQKYDKVNTQIRCDVEISIRHAGECTGVLVVHVVSAKQDKANKGTSMLVWITEQSESCDLGRRG